MLSRVKLAFVVTFIGWMIASAAAAIEHTSASPADPGFGARQPAQRGVGAVRGWHR